jgi:hypothetical protein
MKRPNIQEASQASRRAFNREATLKKYSCLFSLVKEGLEMTSHINYNYNSLETSKLQAETETKSKEALGRFIELGLTSENR